MTDGCTKCLLTWYRKNSPSMVVLGGRRRDYPHLLSGDGWAMGCRDDGACRGLVVDERHKHG
jgi:hypothetical protein